MNPYYQVYKKPKRRRGWGVVAAVTAAVLFAVLLMLFWLIWEPGGVGETGGGQLDGADMALTEELSRPAETVGGIDDTGAATDAPVMDTQDTAEPLPDPDRPVSYLSREEVEAWAPQVADCLARIQARLAADEIVSIGLFDFEPDGRPEVVVGRPGANTNAGYPGRYVLTVYDLDGEEEAALTVGAEFPELVHYSRAGKYPCAASYRYQFRTRDDSGRSVWEDRFVMADEWPRMRVVYGTQVYGSTVTYTVDGQTSDRDTYVEQNRSADLLYSEEPQTRITEIRLTTAMDPKERAETLVRLPQEFIRP